eukprot:scaffold801_cov178-Ochromonas_danica.AAC.14
MAIDFVQKIQQSCEVKLFVQNLPEISTSGLPEKLKKRRGHSFLKEPVLFVRVPETGLAVVLFCHRWCCLVEQRIRRC